MPAILGSLRQAALAPSPADVTFAARGFPGATSVAARQLEAIPQSVVIGFEWGIADDDLWSLERRLDLLDVEHRGFGYEGAAMAFVIRDAMGGGKGHRTRDLLLGPGASHVLLAYIGIGFAMTRLPRPLWRKVIPDMSGSRYYPTMTWLAVDGYAFDLAYFHTRKYVGERQRPKPYPWEGAPEYFSRVVDQGIGRALWFIHGADPDAVASAVSHFAAARRPDLWSGVGLAATFAGGVPVEALSVLRDEAGDQWPQLGLGAVLAITARSYAGHIPEHSAHATEVLTGRSATEAVAIADSAEATSHLGGDQASRPLYEQWRTCIRESLAEGSIPRSTRRPARPGSNVRPAEAA